MEGRNTSDLTGRVAVVTGGASGIGAATVEALAARGAHVAVADVRVDVAEAVAARDRPGQGSVFAVALDVRDEGSVAAAVGKVIDELGRVDVLVNSAALTDPAHQARDGAVASAELEVWEQTFAVDLHGLMLVCKHALPSMIASGRGSIVNISSNSSLAGDLGLAAYASAKAGVNSLTLSIATSYGKQGIRCNAVSPGGIRGPSFRTIIPQEVQDVMERNCLLPSLGEPEDVASVIAFLASDEARFITGQVLRVDGGMLSQLIHVPSVRAIQAQPAEEVS